MTNVQFAKVVVFTSALVPAALLSWDYTHNALGADPANRVLHATGDLAIIFLLLVLAVTPLRRITGIKAIFSFRRMLGLYAFFYAALHLCTFILLRHAADIGAAIKEILGSNFILYGLSAFLLLVPLALTSTAGMVKRLGAKRWKLLHRLVYAAGILAVIHYYFNGKVVVTTLPTIAAGILAALLLFRVAALVWDKYFKPRTAQRTRALSEPSRTP